MTRHVISAEGPVEVEILTEKDIVAVELFVMGDRGAWFVLDVPEFEAYVSILNQFLADMKKEVGE